MGLQLSALIKERPATIRVAPYAEIPYEEFPLEYDPAAGRHVKLPREWQDVVFIVRTPNLAVFQKLNQDDLLARVDYIVDVLIRACEGIEDEAGRAIAYDKKLRGVLRKQLISSPFLLKAFQDCYVEHWERSDKDARERDEDFFAESSVTLESTPDPEPET